jgi:hypothetical protein
MRSPSRALFPPLPSPVALVAWIMDCGDDVVCVRRHLWIRRSAATLTLREYRLHPMGLATVIRQVLALSEAGTGFYGRLAWPWSLMSPSLRQHAPKYVQYSHTLWELTSWWTAATGNYAYAFRMDVRRDVFVAPGVFLSLTSNLLIILLTTPRGH